MVVGALLDVIVLLGPGHGEVQGLVLTVLVVIGVVLVAVRVLRGHVMVGWVLVVVRADVMRGLVMLNVVNWDNSVGVVVHSVRVVDGMDGVRSVSVHSVLGMVDSVGIVHVVMDGVSHSVVRRVMMDNDGLNVDWVLVMVLMSDHLMGLVMRRAYMVYLSMVAIVMHSLVVHDWAVVSDCGVMSLSVVHDWGVMSLDVVSGLMVDGGGVVDLGVMYLSVVHWSGMMDDWSLVVHWSGVMSVVDAVMGVVHGVVGDLLVVSRSSMVLSSHVVWLISVCNMMSDSLLVMRIGNVMHWSVSMLDSVSDVSVFNMVSNWASSMVNNRGSVVRVVNDCVVGLGVMHWGVMGLSVVHYWGVMMHHLS